VRLEVEHEIEAPGQEIKHLFFIESGIGSMTTLFNDGSQVEVGLFGNESVIGVSSLMGTKRSLNNIYMQAAGDGFTSETQVAMREFRRYGEFHDLVLRYVQAQLMQTAQTAGCNGRHQLEQRLSRWLLLCADRLETNVIGLTHEFLSHMLGTGRPTVTLALESLRDKNLIEYSRGKIRILDHDALEGQSCECYRIVKNHLENYHEVETGFGA
jgi:CRP-like cAMP-binding protein